MDFFIGFLTQVLPVFFLFAKLRQNPLRGFWMKESDVQSFGTFAGLFVNELDAIAFHFS